MSGPATVTGRTCERCGELYDSSSVHTCNETSQFDIAVNIPPRPASEDPLIDSVIGERYSVIKRLSAGGMGVVYKAKHVLLDADVAIKILLKPQDPDAQYRFLQEAQLASKIRHPNTVYISDFGLLPDGRSYIVMEFLRGPTLSEVIQESPSSPLRTCQVGIQIARGLQAVHDKGIIHRDLKPDNIFLIEQDGQKDFVKIVDFGIATNTAGPTINVKLDGIDPNSAEAQRAMQQRHTLPGTVLGTPHYMSPEQALGEDVDPRADQYALGCILYEMLTGTVPFDDHNPTSLMFKHAYRPPPSLRERMRGVELSESLEKVVMRTMAKKRDQRFASMRDLEQALLTEIELLTGKKDNSRLSALDLPVFQEKAPPTPQGLPARLFSQVLKNPLWAGLAAFLFVGVFGAAGYFVMRPSGQQIGERPDTQALLALRAAAVAVLKDDLRSSDVELRRGAAQALGSTYEHDVPTLLSALLADSEQSVRVRACEALGQLGQKSVVPAISKLLESSEDQPVVLTAAAEALDQLGDARGQKILRQALAGKNDNAKLAAARYLCGRGDREAKKILGAAVQRGKVPDEGAIDFLTRLAQAGDPAARDNLLTRLSSNPNREVQLNLAAALARLGEARGRDFLREQSRRPGQQQLRAAALLASLDEPMDPELFRAVLFNKEAVEKARSTAVFGLGYVGSTQDLPKLKPILLDVSAPKVRQAAAIAMIRISDADPTLGAAQSLGWAAEAAGDQNWMLGDQAVAALSDIRSRDGVAALIRILKRPDADPGARYQAALALGRRKEPAAQQALREQLEDSDPIVRLLARAGLLSHGDEAQRPAVVEALRSGDEATRRLLIEAVDHDKELLARGLEDPVVSVRQLAARKLAALGDKRAVPVLREAANQKPVNAEGLLAYAALRRLGDTEETPSGTGAESAATSDDVALRAAALEALAAQGLEAARPTLERALRDPDRTVRLKVVEVLDELTQEPRTAAALPIAQPLLRRLTRDSDLVVRARANALWSRLRSQTSPTPSEPAPAPLTAEPDKDKAKAATTTAPPTNPTPVVATERPNPASDGKVEGDDASKGKIDWKGLKEDSHDQAESLLRIGSEAFKRKDYQRAQKELERLSTLCHKDASGPCASVAFKLAYNLGRTYEAQGQLAEAMNEFARLEGKEGRRGGSIEERIYLADAVERLKKKLGRIEIHRKKRGRCQSETLWVTPGEQEVRLSPTEKTSVRVSANEKTSVGVCP